MAGELVAMVCRDQRGGKIKPRKAAGAGDVVAIHDKKTGLQAGLGERLGKGLFMLPMDRAGIAIKQSGAREDEGPTRDAGKAGAETAGAAMRILRWRRR